MDTLLGQQMRVAEHILLLKQQMQANKDTYRRVEEFLLTGEALKGQILENNIRLKTAIDRIERGEADILPQIE